MCLGLIRWSVIGRAGPNFHANIWLGWKCLLWSKTRAGNPCWRGRLSTVDLLVLNYFRSAPFYIEIPFTIVIKTSCLIEDVNCTEPSPSVSVPWPEWRIVQVRHSRVGSWPYPQILDKVRKSLLRIFVNYDRKKFINIGSWAQCYKTFLRP